MKLGEGVGEGSERVVRDVELLENEQVRELLRKGREVAGRDVEDDEGSEEGGEDRLEERGHEVWGGGCREEEMCRAWGGEGTSAETRSVAFLFPLETLNRLTDKLGSQPLTSL